MRRVGSIAVVCSTLVIPSQACAHLVATQFGNFYSGVLHPLTALEHLLAWFALGLLVGLHRDASARWILLLFPLCVLLGAASAWFVPVFPHISQVNIGSFVLLGILAATAFSLPTVVMAVVGVLMGMSHGYENGLAMATSEISALYIGGVAISGYVVLTLIAGISAKIVLRFVWGKVAIRALGSWIAAIGIVMVGLSLVTTT